MKRINRWIKYRRLKLYSRLKRSIIIDTKVKCKPISRNIPFAVKFHLTGHRLPFSLIFFLQQLPGMAPAHDFLSTTYSFVVAIASSNISVNSAFEKFVVSNIETLYLYLYKNYIPHRIDKLLRGFWFKFLRKIIILRPEWFTIGK